MNGCGFRGAEPHRYLELRQRLVRTIEETQHETQTRMGRGVAGIECHGLLQVLRRLGRQRRCSGTRCPVRGLAAGSRGAIDTARRPSALRLLQRRPLVGQPAHVGRMRQHQRLHVPRSADAPAAAPPAPTSCSPDQTCGDARRQAGRSRTRSGWLAAPPRPAPAPAAAAPAANYVLVPACGVSAFAELYQSRGHRPCTAAAAA